MASFFSFLKKHPLPSKTSIRSVFSRTQSVYTAITWLFFAITAVLVYCVVLRANNRFLTNVPAYGGTLTEGIIGTPRNTTPLTSTTATDRIVVQLLYAGLTKALPDNTIVPELADHTISANNTIHMFSIKKEAIFSDGTPVTSDDVIATLQASTDPFWKTVRITAPNTSTVIIASADSDPHNMTNGIDEAVLLRKTTIGISKKDKPAIGAGPFALQKTRYNNGIISELVLVRNAHYVLGTPFLKHIVLMFFPNQETLLSAVQRKQIDMTADLHTSTLTTSIQKKLPRVFSVIPINKKRTIALYRRNDEPVLAQPATRALFSQYIDKKDIVAIVENGYGITDSVRTITAADARKKISTINASLKTTILPIAVENDPNIIATARALAEQLSTIGITASVKVFDPGAFQEGVQKKHYSVILATTPDTIIPTGYDVVLPLYTQVVPYIVNRHSGGTTPNDLSTTITRFANAPNWYADVDRIWKKH